MNRNKWIKNLIYLVIIFALFISGIFLLENHLSQARQSFDYNYIYITFIILIFFGGIGIVMGLSSKNLSLTSPNKIEVDKMKLIVLGIPSLVVSLTYLWVYLGWLDNFYFIQSNILNINYIITISSILLGHTIISSIYKR